MSYMFSRACKRRTYSRNKEIIMVTDPISDLIIRLKNAQAVKKESICVPFSQFKFAIANKLKERGYVGNVSKKGKKIRKSIEIELKYDEDGAPRIKGVTRVSKPGRRIYTDVANIKPVKYGKGSLIISTPKGVLTDSEAKKENTGGEALFKIW